MRKKIAEHIGSIIFIGLVFVVIFTIWGPTRNSSPYTHLKEIKELNDLRFLDLSNPEDRVMLHEALDFIEPDRIQEHDSLLSEIKSYMNELLRAEPGSSGASRGLTMKKTGSLLLMLAQFGWVYVLVLLLTTYSVETFAAYRFIRNQQPERFWDPLKSGWHNLLHHRGWAGKFRGGFAIKMAGNADLIRTGICNRLFIQNKVRYRFRRADDSARGDIKWRTGHLHAKILHFPDC